VTIVVTVSKERLSTVAEGSLGEAGVICERQATFSQ